MQQKDTFGQQEATMKKTGKCRFPKEPEYIIVDDRARVFAGLRGGYYHFSENIDDAKPLEGQSKFDNMQSYHYTKLEQIFI